MAWRAFEKIHEALDRRPSELADAKSRGQKVIGWIGYNVPEELIYACGMIPVRISRGGDNRLAEIGANYISAQNCFMLRQCMGIFDENSDPCVRQLDAIVTDTTCLQLHRMSSLIEYYFRRKVLHLCMPQDPQRPEGRVFFAHEIRFLAERLAEIAGCEFDQARLRDAMKLYQGIREVMRELYLRAAGKGGALSWRQFNEIVHAGYLLDRKQYFDLLVELLMELPETAAEAGSAGAVRVLLAGSPMAPGDQKLVEIIEACGAQVAGDLLWSASAQFADLDFEEFSMQGLTESYLDRLPHAALPFMEVDTDRKLITLLERVRQSEAKGVVYYSLRYCDPFSFKMLVTKNYLQKAGIPLMEAQTDYGEQDIETLRTRVEAFVEMLAIRP